MTDDQFAWWLAGFCDGEAHFGVTLRTSTAGRTTGSPRFNITLREDDVAVLELAQKRLGVGKLRPLSRAYERLAGGASRDAVAWEATGPSCRVIAEALAGKMRSKKAQEFEVWRKAVLASASMPRYDARRAPLMLETAARLRELRAR